MLNGSPTTKLKENDESIKVTMYDFFKKRAA